MRDQKIVGPGRTRGSYVFIEIKQSSRSETVEHLAKQSLEILDMVE